MVMEKLVYQELKFLRVVSLAYPKVKDTSNDRLVRLLYKLDIVVVELTLRRKNERIQPVK